MLLHGWTVDADLNWFTCYEPLARRFRVLAMDHRGHGRGIRSWRPFRLEDCADDVAALAEELGVERLIPVGYSMGGPIAQLTWRRHPDLVAGLVLCATARGFSRRTFANRAFFASLLGLSVAARVTPAPVRRQVAESVIRRRIAGAPIADWGLAELQRNDPATVLQAGWAIGRFRSHDWISKVDVPTAVVVTTNDQVVAPRRQLALAAAIPGAKTYPIAADHGACVTDAGVFVPALTRACLDVTQPHVPST
jgi:3-oxoadipate enol-lactonase